MFAWLELRTHCHATEDERKVMSSLQTLCPAMKPTVRKAEGYHRNPILMLAARTERRKEIMEFWRMIRDNGMIEPILGSLENEVDESGILHFRIGKQSAFLGRPAIATDDDAIVVRLKVARRPGVKRDALDEVRDELMEMVEKNVPDT